MIPNELKLILTSSPLLHFRWLGEKNFKLKSCISVLIPWAEPSTLPALHLRIPDETRQVFLGWNEQHCRVWPRASMEEVKKLQQQKKIWIYSRIWWTNPIIQDWGLICPFRLSEATLRERETSWRHLPWLSPVLEWVGGWLMVAGGGRWSFMVASCLCTASVNPLDLKLRKCRSL